MALAERLRSCLYQPQTAPMLSRFFLSKTIFCAMGYRRLPREAGYAVVESGSGEEALDLCKSGMSIDVTVTDINLGGSASGWEVAKRFRSEQPDIRWSIYQAS